MEKRRRVVLLFCLLFLVGMMSPCLGLAEEADQAKEAAASGKSYDDWRFLFYLPGWLPALSGDVKAKGVTEPVHVGYVKQLENLVHFTDYLALGHLEVQKGRWVLLLEGIYGQFTEKENFFTQTKLGIIAPIGTPVAGQTKVTTGTLIGEGSLLYDLYRSDSTIKNNQPVVTVEGLVGARVLYFTTKLEVTGPLGLVSASTKNKIDWVDPIIGGRVLWNLSDRWMAGFRADVGGFGLVSNFTANLDGSLTYRANNWLRFMGGFRALYEDHHGGSRNSKFVYDLWTYAPWLGVGVEF